MDYIFPLRTSLWASIAAFELDFSPNASEIIKNGGVVLKFNL